MKWHIFRDALLQALKRAFFPSSSADPSADASPAAPAGGPAVDGSATPQPPAESGNSPVQTPVPSWDKTVHASCWNGSNASERMMNVLSPKMTDSTFGQRLSFMLSRGCDTAHVILVNQADGEASGYSPWGVGKAPAATPCDPSTVALMLGRIARLRASGLAVVVWIVTDDSTAWAKALFQNAVGAVASIHASGLLADASYVVLGLEMDEYGTLSQWTALKTALRAAGYSGKIGVHHTSGKYPFASIGDIVLDQLDPSKSTASAIAASVNALRASGKPVVGFEYSRGPDRAKAQDALYAGAFAVGNW